MLFRSGHWRPKQYETDRFAVACADPIARRKELAERYGGCTDDPEAEYAAYAAKPDELKDNGDRPSRTSSPSIFFFGSYSLSALVSPSLNAVRCVPPSVVCWPFTKE